MKGWQEEDRHPPSKPRHRHPRRAQVVSNPPGAINPKHRLSDLLGWKDRDVSMYYFDVAWVKLQGGECISRIIHGAILPFVSPVFDWERPWEEPRKSPVAETALGMLVVLSNLRGILVRGPDGSGWLVSHGCRGFDRPFVGIVLLGFNFWWSDLQRQPIVTRWVN